MSKVTFDGPNKLIICNSGITTLDVTVDLYSDWKEWVISGMNITYLPAFRVVGGDPLYGAVVLAPSYFLTNGWRVRPDEANHRLTVEGNLFTEEGTSPYVQTIGSYNVLTNQVVTSDPKLVTASGAITATVDEESIATAVWSKSLTGQTAGYRLTNLTNVDTNEVASGVWNYLISGLAASEYLRNILGLSQSNFRIKDQIYSNGKLVSSIIRLYTSNADCIADSNYFKQYSVSATYNGAGELTSYTVTED